MKYFSLDVEATGLNTSKCALLQVALVAEDTEHSVISVSQLPHLNLLIDNHDRGLYWEPGALRMHQKTGLLQKALDPGYPPTDVGRWLQQGAKGGMHLVQSEDAAHYMIHHWLATFKADGNGKHHLAGKNIGSYDTRFFPAFVLDLFSHRFIDVGSVCLDWSKGPQSLQEITNSTTPHTAYEDACLSILALRKTYPVKLATEGCATIDANEPIDGNLLAARALRPGKLVVNPNWGRCRACSGSGVLDHPQLEYVTNTCQECGGRGYKPL